MSNNVVFTSASTNDDPCAAFLVPPKGLVGKYRYYSARYGALHTICSYIGRYWFWWWLFVGPIVTRRYLRKWLASPGLHILNLGGGGVLSNQWLTADVTPRADVFIDITKPLPLPDGVADAVYSEEVIEHVDREVGQRMLKECFRILKPGGTLRLTTPSLDYFMGGAISSVEAVQQINDIFYCHGHRHVYTKASLAMALKQAGFIGIVQSSYRDAKSKYGGFDSHPARFAFAPAEWSQYWEADKPAK
jgi:predicted SAM-dependent methyltransferase